MHDVPPDDARAIEAVIRSPDSPVGIDATKTHVYIIHMLHRIESQVRDCERRIGRIEQSMELRETR